MNYKLTLVQDNDCFHVIVTGKNSKETIAGYLDELLRKCIEQDHRKLLIEERLEGPRLDTLNVFQLAEQFAVKAVGKFTAIAYVDDKMQGEMMHFAETVAVNRGIRGAGFKSVSDAKDWLLKQNSGNSEYLSRTPDAR